MADIARLTALIEPEATALGFDLVRVAMLPSEAGDGGMALSHVVPDQIGATLRNPFKELVFDHTRLLVLSF